MTLDSFIGLDAAEGGISPEKVREFQARMARNQQMMAAARKQEAKQKKKEDKLFLILLKFLKNNHKTELTLLVARCLEQNIPAVFILAIIILGNEEIQKELDIKLELPEGNAIFSEDESSQSDANSDASTIHDTPHDAMQAFENLESPETKGALVTFGSDRTFPLKMRITIDLWGKTIWDAASPIPEKILKTVAENPSEAQKNPEPPEPKPVVTQLTAFVLRDYFRENQFEQLYENVKSFSEFLMRGILRRIKEQTENQIQVEGETY